jgi:hypothetical protein
VLTENEKSLAWANAYEADVRSLYFGEQSGLSTKYKQYISGISLLLSSGAVVTLLASTPKLVPTILAVIVAVLSAYSLTVGLDKRISTLCKLHSEWNYLHSEYRSLWDHWYEDGAQENLRELLRRGRDASQNAAELTHDEEAMDKWEKIVQARLKGESV